MLPSSPSSFPPRSAPRVRRRRCRRAPFRASRSSSFARRRLLVVVLAVDPPRFQSYYSGKAYPINQRDITAYQPHFANEVMGTLGRVRLRQLRVKDDACTVSSYLSGRVGGCYAPYRAANEETERWAVADAIEGLEWRDYSDGGARTSPNTKTWCVRARNELIRDSISAH